jgi:uncharacterized protein YacL
MGEVQKASYAVVRASGERVDIMIIRDDGRQEPNAYVFGSDGTMVVLQDGVEKIRFRRTGL